MNLTKARTILKATQDDVSDDDLKKLLSFMEQISVLLLINLDVLKESKV